METELITKEKILTLGPNGPTTPGSPGTPYKTHFLKNWKKSFELNFMYLLEIFPDHTSNFFLCTFRSLTKPILLMKEKCAHFYK